MQAQRILQASVSPSAPLRPARSGISQTKIARDRLCKSGIRVNAVAPSRTTASS